MSVTKRLSSPTLNATKKPLPGIQKSPRSSGGSRRDSMISGINEMILPDFDEDRVKFTETPSIVDNFDSDYNKLASEFDHMDETMKLFHSMPRGLAYFITAGPPKQVHEYSDYVKVCKQYDRLVAELSQQDEPREERWKMLTDKKIKFLEAMETFDHFLKDNDRKRARAKEHYFKHLCEKRHLKELIPDLKAELESIKRERDHMRKQMNRYKPVGDFMDAIIRIPDGQFKNVPDIMHRYSTLYLTYQSQMYRLVRSMEFLDKSSNLVDTMIKENNNYVLYLRGEITNKSKKRDALIRVNSDRERDVSNAEQHRTSQMIEAVQIRNSIKNIVNLLATFRPFTTKRLFEKDDIVSQMEAIGIIISDYGIILAKLQEEKRIAELRRVKMMRKEEAKNRKMSIEQRTSVSLLSEEIAPPLKKTRKNK